MRSRLILPLLILVSPALAALPGEPRQTTQFPMPWGMDVPGAMALDLPKPAGKLGNVVCRDGHFYTGNQRIRFWGVNIAFGGNFPTHDQADAVARRLSRYGFNCVRMHHMDNQPFPNGIWADRKCETLSPEALDRLDYFIAALQREGVYVNLNLHVSRMFARNHNWPNLDGIDSYDKIIDLFHPDLVAAQKQYAHDLLTHVNKYTHNRLADEPSVAIVEINNEDGIFMWGSDQKINSLPDPYSALLGKLWNAWLAKEYPSRDALKAAWARGEQGEGDTLIDPNKKWTIEQHDSAKMEVSQTTAANKPDFSINVTNVDATSWHLQLCYPGLKIRKGHFYTLRFRAQAIAPGTEISVAVAEAHEPWNNLGLSSNYKLDPTGRFYFGTLVATADDDNARVSFSVGRTVTQIKLGDVSFAEGGRYGLGDSEDPAKGTVARHSQRAETQARTQDWYRFLQQLDEKFWTGMEQYLKHDLGVKAAITGTIGFGPLGTLSQSKMDFVDQHSYWEHPQFPHRQWDPRDWVIPNKSMTDNPSGATLWALAATRIAGKPFTVTEYQHSSPNEWQAECMPMIATFASLQDWDGIFIFAYTHNTKYEKSKMDGFFDIEGDVLKMAPAPLAARIFLGQSIPPIQPQIIVHPTLQNILLHTPQFWHESWGYLRQEHGLTWQNVLTHRLAISYEPQHANEPPSAPGDNRAAWTSQGPSTGTGQFLFRDPHAAVFTGFASGQPIDLGSVRLSLQTPFATLIVIPANPKQTLESADKLLVSVIGRAQNTGMKWNPQRTSVSDQWGAGPMRVEVIQGELSIKSVPAVTITALDGSGNPAKTIPSSHENGWIKFPLGQSPWYEITRSTPR